MKRSAAFWALFVVILAVAQTSCAASPASPRAAEHIRGREYKILLKPEKFSDRAQALRTYRDQAKSLAQALGGTAADASEPYKETLRQVVFLDSADGSLYGKQYILRKRTEISGDELAPRYELTLKYRQTDLDLAAQQPLHSRGSGRPGNHRFWRLRRERRSRGLV